MQLLLILGTASLATGGAIVVGPRLAIGRNPAHVIEGAHPGEAPSHAAVIDLLATLILECTQVVAVHEPGGPDRTLDIVLRTRAGGGSGTTGDADLGEILVISHSRLLESIRVHAIPEDSGGRSIRMEPAALKSRAFPARFRSNPAVEARIAAVGVGDLRVERLSDNPDRGASVRLTLTFTPESADGRATVTRVVHGARWRS